MKRLIRSSQDSIFYKSMCRVTVDVFPVSIVKLLKEKAGTEIILCRRFEPPFHSHPHPIWSSPLLHFFRTSHFWEDSSENIAPLKYQVNTNINSFGKVISSFFRTKKIMLHAFFCKQHFYKQHLTEI